LYNFLFKPGTHPQPAEGRLWAPAWFIEIVLQKACVYICLFVCLFVRVGNEKNQPPLD